MQRLDERFRAIADNHAVLRDQHVHLELTHLPTRIPEPSLVGRDRLHRPQFDDTIWALSDFELGAGLIKSVALADGRGESDETSGLHRNEAVEGLNLTHGRILLKN